MAVCPFLSFHLIQGSLSTFLFLQSGLWSARNALGRGNNLICYWQPETDHFSSSSSLQTFNFLISIPFISLCVFLLLHSVLHPLLLMSYFPFINLIFLFTFHLALKHTFAILVDIDVYIMCSFRSNNEESCHPKFQNSYRKLTFSTKTGTSLLLINVFSIFLHFFVMFVWTLYNMYPDSSRMFLLSVSNILKYGFFAPNAIKRTIWKKGV